MSLTVSLVAFPVAAGVAQKPPPAAAHRTQKDPGKQPAAQGPAKDLIRAWNRGDSVSIAKLFVPDGVLIMPTASVVKSRSETQKTIAKERQGRLKDTTLRNTFERSQWWTTATTIVTGRYMVEGLKILGIGTSYEGTYVFRRKKQQGRWMIAKAEVLKKKNE